MLEVTTGSRLHFGLLELAAGRPLRFGGLGLMLEEPGWVLRFSGCDTLHKPTEPIGNDIDARIESVRDRLRQQTAPTDNVHVEVRRVLPLHAGLGAGTQLAAAVAVGLTLYQRPTAQPTINELIQWSGRGKRSGIGLYGFLHGGLILDEGHVAHSPESPRTLNALSSVMNPEWRVVLITPDRVAAVTGGYEASLIEKLGQTPNPNRDRMHSLAKRVLELAGIIDGFREFTSVLQEYVDAAGELFAAGQGGMYNGPVVQQAVELAKRAGLRAVGQSSWGPTVFGFASNPKEAEHMEARILELHPVERWQTRICTPARQGADWRWIQE